MANINQKIRQIVKPVTALFPNTGSLDELIDHHYWATNACDQQNGNYWDSVRHYVGDYPTTLDLMIPESSVSSKNEEDIEKIVSSTVENMNLYLKRKYFIKRQHSPGFIYTERSFDQDESQKTRKGLVVALDLENYDFKSEVRKKPLIRPTEKTFSAKTKIRTAVRMHAPIELPHIIMLFDDPKNLLFDSISELGKKEAYRFNLMSKDLPINTSNETTKAYLFKQPNVAMQKIYGSLEKIFRNREDNLFIASGDGNHSMAAAKTAWEKIKGKLASQGKPWKDHPARYVMVELINIHDNSYEFEPINRIVTNISEEKEFINLMREYYGENFKYLSLGEKVNIEKELQKATNEKPNDNFHLVGTYGTNEEGQKEFGIIELPKKHTLSVGTLEEFLQKGNHGAKFDYIHGNDDVNIICQEIGTRGFYFLPINKKDLLNTVIKHGVTPPKTFSVPHKNYYILARAIKSEKDLRELGANIPYIPIEK